MQHIFKCALDNWLYCFISTQTAYAVWFCWINSVHTPTILISFCNFPTHSHLMLDVTLSAIDRYHPCWQGWAALKHRFSSTPPFVSVAQVNQHCNVISNGADQSLCVWWDSAWQQNILSFKHYYLPCISIYSYNNELNNQTLYWERIHGQLWMCKQAVGNSTPRSTKLFSHHHPYLTQVTTLLRESSCASYLLILPLNSLSFIYCMSRCWSRWACE